MLLSDFIKQLQEIEEENPGIEVGVLDNSQVKFDNWDTFSEPYYNLCEMKLNSHNLRVLSLDDPNKIGKILIIE